MLHLFVLLLLVTSPAHAATFWTDDFENHLTPNWDTTNCSVGQQQDGCNPVISTTQAVSGTHSLKGDYTTTDCLHPFPTYTTCGTYYDRSFTPSTEVYFRFNYKTTGYTYDSTTTKHFYLANGSTYPDVVLKHEYGSQEFGMEIEGDADSCPPTNGPYDSCMYWANMASKPTLNDQWYCIEGHVKYNTAGQADGLLELWVDGTQTMSRTGLTMRGPAASNGGINNSSTADMRYLRVYVQWGEGLMYYDDLAVGNTRIGCSGAPPPADTTPPSQVTSATATAASQSSIVIGHAASTDAEGVTAYDYFRCQGSGCTNFSLVGTNAALSFTNTGLSASTLYRYYVTARDAAGNSSVASSIVEATTSAAGSTTRRQLLSDPITRADSADLGTAWDAGYTGSSAMNVVSNAIQGSTLGAVHMESDNSVTWPNDQWVQAQLVTHTSAALSGGGPACRMGTPATANAYWVDTNGSNNYVIRRRTAGTDATIATSTTPAASSGVLRLECIGSAITLYVNDVAATAATDTNFTSGRAGVMLYVDGALGNTVFDSIVAGDYTVSTPPTITGLTVDATGATLTYGATTPTTIRVQIYSTLATLSDVVEPIASFPSGRYTKTWPQGSHSVCFFPRDSVGAENTDPAAYRCTTLIGVVTQDTTPPVISAGAPTTQLAAGTTSTTESVATNEPARCKRSLTDTTYDLMADQMSTVNGLAHTWTATGLTNGTTYTPKVRCTDQYDASSVLLNNVNDSSYSYSYSVASAGGDTTRPSTGTGLSCSAISGSQISCTFNAATDNVAVTGYEGHLCSDAICTTSSLINPTWSTATTQTISGLTASTQYYLAYKAFDAAGNRSLAFSNVVAVTTLASIDVIPPSNMVNLQIAAAFQRSMLLTWDVGTDDRGPITTAIEGCQAVSPATTCSNFTPVSNKTSGQQLVVSLAPGTVNCFRGRHSDLAGNPSAYSNTVCGTTTTSGLSRPRKTLPFGVSRLPRN